MPPVHPPLKNDGPACRVCGCTQHNACLEIEAVFSHGATKITRHAPIGCRWIQLPPVDSFKPLCSACAGSTEDAMEVIGRLNVMMITKGFRIDDGRAVSAAFLRRLKARREIEAGVPKKTG